MTTYLVYFLKKKVNNGKTDINREFFVSMFLSLQKYDMFDFMTAEYGNVILPCSNPNQDLLSINVVDFFRELFQQCNITNNEGL